MEALPPPILLNKRQSKLRFFPTLSDTLAGRDEDRRRPISHSEYNPEACCPSVFTACGLAACQYVHNFATCIALDL